MVETVDNKLILEARTNYSKEFEGDEEKYFIENIFTKFGMDGLLKIYDSLDNWDAKSNFIKYFVREDAVIPSQGLLEKFQNEYYDYLVEQGYIVSFCGKLK